MNTQAMLSRRSFISATATSAAIAALAATNAQAEIPSTWDYETDLVICGAGAAGLAAAIEATDQGLEVVVLEALDDFMGSSALCNGGISMCGTPLQKEQGIEDSPEKMYEDLVNITSPGNVPELIKVHCDHVGELWDWLTGMGIEFKQESLIGTVGQSVPREHHVTPTVVIETLSSKAAENGAVFLMETPATRLIQSEPGGRVIGVYADAQGTQISLKARRAVLLATGGYSRNAEMMDKWYFGLGNSQSYGGMHDLGEGILMAQQIGAETRSMQYFSLMPVQSPDNPSPYAAAGMMNVGAIMVNLEGERFCDESLGYTQTWPYVAAQTNQVCYQVWDQPIYDAYQSNDSHLYNMERLESAEALIKADTLEELAEAMGVPADAFVAAVEKYNADIDASGYDLVFGRDHLVSENGEPDKIEDAPFYAFKAGLVIYSTTGGLKENERSQVLDMYGEPIPGLYCAGGICNYAKYGVDIAHHSQKSPSGIGFGGAMVYGRLVAQYAAQDEPWE